MFLVQWQPRILLVDPIILSTIVKSHLVVEQQLPLVLRESSADARRSGAEPLLVDGDVERLEVADPAPARAAAASVVGRCGEEDGDRRVGEVVERQERLAGDDAVL